jgi:hypothetical protein
MPHFLPDNSPSIWRFEDNSGGTIGSVEELHAKRRNSAFIESHCLDEFRFGIRVVSQSHPMERRAACMTCS